MDTYQFSPVMYTRLNIIRTAHSFVIPFTLLSLTQYYAQLKIIPLATVS